MQKSTKRVRNRYYEGPKSNHYNGTRFFNPGGIAPLGFRAFFQWKSRDRPEVWPKFYPSPFSPAKPEALIGGSDLRVTMIGHASLLIQVAGLNILTDPVWSDRVSPFAFIGPKRHNAPGLAFDDLPPIDVVLVTHNHYDHLDVSTLKALHRRHAPHIVTPLGNDTIIRRAIADARISVTDWGDETRLQNDVTIHTEPCHHWSARGSRDRRMALWAAFVIETPAGKIYHIGDTGFHDGINYRAAAEKHGGFRLANLPIGAYEPRWFMQGQHQNPEEAVEGMQLANIAHAAGHHWGTFQLTNEAVDAPLRALEQALAARRIEPARFRALRPGEAFDVPPV
ncbi:MBL fold metallo-hydrolase [Rhizobium sp. KVB221]|uniref:MBL fold metallo-hydrolase n=1 Tax=Rhizobium setariae TaxID=2801340 RepID=A0A936YVS3_9HYPH|nr:MBL fold metallo-hydrolase [Rhizobium setariae]MBL0374776.1 MBL fold metallo-hydrolase [Rhizobium setariae]